MKEKLRSVNTKVWYDPWVESLPPKSKLLWIYLITSPYNNMLGVFEVSINRIGLDTGLKNEEILKAFKGFERVKKAYYVKNHVILVNYLKNQRLNNNMWRSAIKKFNHLPNSLKDNYIRNASEGFEMLKNRSERFGKYEIRKGKGNKKENSNSYGEKVDKKSENKKSKPPINYQKVKKLWNKLADKYPNIPKIKKMTDNRRTHIRNRSTDLEDWENIICQVKKSDFLNKNWKGFNFDWVIKNEHNFTKILEGRYDNKNGRSGTEHSEKSREEKGKYKNVKADVIED